MCIAPTLEPENGNIVPMTRAPGGNRLTNVSACCSILFRTPVCRYIHAKNTNAQPARAADCHLRTLTEPRMHNPRTAVIEVRRSGRNVTPVPYCCSFTPVHDMATPKTAMTHNSSGVWIVPQNS